MITYRLTKGFALSWAELDENFRYLTSSFPFRNVKEDYGASGDGVTNDNASITAAAVNKYLIWPEGTYFLGNLAGGSTAIDLSSVGDNIHWITVGNVKITVNTTSGSYNTNPTIVFNLSGNNNSRFGDFEFQDLGFEISSYASDNGAYGFFINALSTSMENVKFGSIRATDMVCPIGVAGSVSTYRAKGISADLIWVKDSVYGPVFQNNGDDFKCPLIITDNVVRSYFAYGVSGHDVFVDSKDSIASSGDINISRTTVSGTAFNTRDMKIRYKSRGSNVLTSTGQGMININHVTGGVSGKIENIHIDFDIADANTAAVPVRITSYVDSGGTIDTPPTSNQWDGIYISGKDNSSHTDTVISDVTPSTRGMMRLNSGGGLFSIPQSVLTDFKLGLGNSYTPTLTGSVSNPSIGDGSIIGYWTLEGNMVHLKVDFIFGSTSTQGSGNWSISIPFTSAAIGQQHGMARLFDSSTGTNRLSDVIIDGGGSVANFVYEASTVLVGSGSPWAWAQGDYISFSISYFSGVP